MTRESGMARPEYLNYLVRREIPRHLQRAVDAATRFVVWRLPRRVIMWAGFRIISHGTTGQWSDQEVPALTAMEAMKRWDIPREPQVRSSFSPSQPPVSP